MAIHATYREFQYPQAMLNYKTACEQLLSRVGDYMYSLTSPTLNDVELRTDVIDFSAESRRLEDYSHCHFNHIHILHGEIVGTYSSRPVPLTHFEHKLILKYKVTMEFTLRPGHFTNYYPNQLKQQLKQLNIRFQESPITLLCDSSYGNRKCIMEVDVDFTKELNEEEALMLQEEYRRLNV